MNEIPNASRPENAPARVAPPKNTPTRYWIMWRGYQSVKLHSRGQTQDELRTRNDHALVDYAGEKTCLRDPKANSCTDELWVAV